MPKLAWLALTSLLAAGGAQAQTWSRFIHSSPVQATALAPQGLAADGHGGVFVQTLDTGATSGTNFSHIYALDGATGNDAYPWSLIGRPGWTDTAFVAKGFNAHAGHRAAWFEVGLPNELQDMIWAFAPLQPTGTELRLDRLDGGRVLAAATDGNGGLLVVRDRSNGWNRPVLRRYARSGAQWSLQWEQMLGSCYPGTIAIAQQDVDIDLDADPNASAVHFLGYCNGGIAGISTHYVQSFDLAGALLAEQRFRLDFPGTLAARHRLGDGAWAYEFAEANGGPRQLQVIDVRSGLYPLNWNPQTGPLRSDAVTGGVLLGARDSVDPTRYEVALAHRVNGGPFVIDAARHYLWQPPFADASTRWSADAFDRRMVAFRSPVTSRLHGPVQLQSYGEGTAIEWSRTISRVTHASPILLQPEPVSGEILVAVDRLREDGQYGVQVERFPLRDRYWCPPGHGCIDPPVDPPPAW